jgi:hypothetical protein
MRLAVTFLKRQFLMDYISNIGPTITKKGNINLHHRIYPGIKFPKKEIFDGLYKQVM